MRRLSARALVAPLILPLLLLGEIVGSAPAIAGGSTMQVVEVSEGDVEPPGGGPAWAAVGATVRMRGGFCNGSQAAPNEGPWFASLRSYVGGARTPLGPVDIVASDNNACPWVATATFVVPNVAVGAYWVDVCDEGCTTGVGDLMGGYFVVAASATEARLIQRLAWLQQQLTHVQKNASIFARRMDALEDRVAQMRGDMKRTRSTLELMAAERDQAVASLAHADQAAAAARAAGVRWRALAIALAAVIGIVIVAMALWWRRRRAENRDRDARAPKEMNEPAESPRSAVGARL